MVKSRRCCSLCNREGHNSRTCTNHDPPGQTSTQEENTSENDRSGPLVNLTLGLWPPGESSSSRPQAPVAATTSTSVRNHDEVLRNRGVRWSAEEHLNFLKGVQAHGNGSWKAISESFVRTRTPNQISSHAQKYHKRRRNPLKRKRNPSIFDVGRDEFPLIFNGDGEQRHQPPPQDDQPNPLPLPPPEAKVGRDEFRLLPVVPHPPPMQRFYVIVEQQQQHQPPLDNQPNPLPPPAPPKSPTPSPEARVG